VARQKGGRRRGTGGIKEVGKDREVFWGKRRKTELCQVERAFGCRYRDRERRD